ncbi:hypothetical protein [Curtobacterium sp. MCPF17_052]|uniref:hypothetical protein n=1 Tax=Curtobacterium sp. MCPF17_052 TaxID=2175655 RepID=UPI0024DF772D|nr:hypothetical protein [Curtobacterium sp. MCPF17_052]WIB12993.1 hypothetical protein DEJ36_03080 [Curtobacterium sp. MCPF17_052]
MTVRSGDDAQEVQVTSGSTATVTVPSAQQITISGAEGLVAGVTYQGGRRHRRVPGAPGDRGLQSGARLPVASEAVGHRPARHQ